MLVSQESLCGALQTVNVCTTVPSFHLPILCKENAGSRLKRRLRVR